MAFGLLSGTSGVQPDFLSRLEALRRALPNNLGAQIGVKSAYRSPAHQAELFNRAVQKYGSVAAARKWVAPPGHSQHNRGNAIDLSYGSPEAMRAAHQYASQFGLTFPMSYENWHIEPIGARGGGQFQASQTAPSGQGPDPGVANLLADASAPSAPSATSAPSTPSGSSLSPGFVGDSSPIQVPDLRTPPPQALSSPAAVTPPIPGPDPGQLAGLFTLPTIGLPGVDPNAAVEPALPGQAKQLTRKVWK
jgi:hypothetical protein